jgi:tetratricopeptide (TPR) repeat protein
MSVTSELENLSGLAPSTRVMQILEQFEAAWQRGVRPAIDDYLVNNDADPLTLLVGLVNVDLEWRLRQHEMACVEGYLGRYPQLAADPRIVLGLIKVEFQGRHGARAPEPSEYLRRFPQLGAELRQWLSGQLSDQTDEALGKTPRIAPQAQPGEATQTHEPASPCAASPGSAATESVPTLLDRAPEAPDRWATLAPTDPVGVPAPASRWPSLDGYEILGELGAGGMGVVYAARHKNLNRRVAIKMLGRGRAARPDELVRFMNEAEAVARIRHPNVVQVYEVGQHEGSPFFSMEMMEGGSLSRRQAGTPLVPEQAAALVQTLARAMAAVHQQGILHRDLKPANILLTRKVPASSTHAGNADAPAWDPSEWEPKVTDFGLAKWLQLDSGLTRTGLVMGTPSYMAPEQAEGRHKDLGPPADIYSLGTILYELLVGRPPFKAASTAETLRQVLLTDPVPPSQLQPNLPRDLETICLKCLEKEPARRYPTAGALADDLGRFLAGESVMARPLGLWGRTVRWSRRRPAVAALLAALALVLAGSIAGLTSLWLKAVRGERLAIRYREEALNAGDQFFTQLLESPELMAAGAEGLREKLLARGVEYFENLLQQREDTSFEGRRGQQYYRLAAIQQAQGKYTSAIENYQNARAIFEQLSAAKPEDPAYRRNLGGIHNNLGQIFQTLGKYDEAAEEYEKARTLKETLVEAEPRQPDYALELAKTYGNLAGLDADRGNGAAARSTYQKALRLLEGLSQTKSTDPEVWRDLATTYNNLGNLEVREKEHVPQGKTKLLEGLAIRRRLANEHPEDPDFLASVAESLTNLGSYYETEPALGLAEENYREALELFERLGKDHLRVVAFRIHACQLRVGLAHLLREQREGKALEEARALCTRAVAELNDCLRLAPQAPDARECLADAHWEQAFLLALTKDFDRALADAQTLAQTAPRSPGENSKNLASTFALASEGAARYAEPTRRQELAERYADQALSLLRKARQEGYFQNPEAVGDLRREGDLKALRNRLAFLQLLQELSEATRRAP